MGAAPRRVQHIVEAMATAEGPAERARLRGWGGPAVVRAEVDAAEAALRDAQVFGWGERGARWYQWVQCAMAGGAGRVYKWIKAGAPPTPTLVPDPAADRAAGGDGAPAAGTRRWVTSMRGGPAVVARLLEGHWRKFWQRPVAGPLPEQWARAWDA
eukprot:4431540-Lingulodinium_polyedra.AAC.1